MSTNISKQKREDLLAKIKAIRTYIATAPQDENTANLLAYLAELEQDIGTKKYGLVYEEHREEIDEILSTHTPVLTEDTSLFIEGGGQMNFLIEGDNLASLQLLEKTHRGKIDLIYIDPPYNTGNRDFKYDDVFVDINDSFRHSKWLSFLFKRLQLARVLLSENGVIFVSIDDNEQAELKLLMDKIFGEENFVTCFHWEKTQHFGRQKINSYSNCEYILCYAKQLSKEKIKELLVERINCSLTDAPLFNASNNEKDLVFPIGSVKFNIPDGEYYTTESPDYLLLKTVTIENGRNKTPLCLRFRSRWAQSTIETEYAKGTTFWVKSKKFAIRTIYHEGKTSTVAPRSLIFTNSNNPQATQNRFLEKVGVNENATAELTELLGCEIFSYPKPTNLLTYLISLYYNGNLNQYHENFTILDFFAGSGTTGHAVMKLNAEDGGNRRFILCTNNENNICREVTYERIKRVIERDHYVASLKYYKVDYIPISERFYYEYANELLLHIRELVELENAINFTGNTEVGIVITEDELTAFVQDEEKITKCKKIYVGHDVLFTEEQQAIIEQKGIVISIIPDYYYRDLQEG